MVTNDPIFKEIIYFSIKTANDVAHSYSRLAFSKFHFRFQITGDLNQIMVFDMTQETFFTVFHCLNL